MFQTDIKCQKKNKRKVINFMKLKGALYNFLWAYKQTKRALDTKKQQFGRTNLSFRCTLKPYVYMFYEF